MTQTLLAIENLSVGFRHQQTVRTVVNDVSLQIEAGETLALVGESGSGKSVTALSILRLLPSPPVEYLSGDIRFHGESLLHASDQTLRGVRGNKIAMIFQEPMVSLNPLHTLEKQLYEVLSLHRGMRREAARGEILNCLDRVGIRQAAKRLTDYPHQLSGGERQRVMIAMALACEPKLLIADEPTTALDVTIQEQILHLIRKLNEKMGMSVLFITHDMGAVSQLCHSVKVMYLGQIVEDAVTEELFSNPLHPYTKGLLSCIPHLGVERDVELSTIHGAVPSISQIPDGCHFCTRCRYADKKCERQQPPLIEVTSGHFVKCWKYIDKGNAESEE